MYPEEDKPSESSPPQDKDHEESGDPVDPDELSAEEQLARYEESLKNDDWGHQPC